MIKFGKVIYTQLYQSPLGSMRLAASEDGLVGAWFAGQKHEPADAECAKWVAANTNPHLNALQTWFDGYFAAGNVLKMPELWASSGLDKLTFDLSVGTTFQQQVWRALRDIPFGETTSYGLLAAKLGRPKAARAIGGAVGRNPLSVVIPCHRVMGATGAITGYAGGVARKQALLQLELVQH